MCPNHLKDEKSLYLRQHADNPVDWYPWGSEAFEKAMKEDKPIFLSIGYSACHWCHVMARESFQDPEVAEVLNRDFVCIKVDREERPDIDSIYMTACQLLTGRGGWPLSVVITPDRRPFFATSFIPRRSMPGAMGVIELMAQLADAWNSERAKVVETAEAVHLALTQFADRLDPQELKGNEVTLAYQGLLNSFDQKNTGFNGAQKFPTPHRLMFLIDYYSRTKEVRALDMAVRTLKRMRESGLFDHVGFGFFRYSTDRGWHLPHFEKTLYDQAILTMAYVKAFMVTGDNGLKWTAEAILAYVNRSLISPQGLFYSAESADSEGKEGKFYLWTVAELRRILSPSELDLVQMAFDLKDEGNFHDEATRELTGSNLLDISTPVASVADASRMSEEAARRAIEGSLGKMFDVREKRVHPEKDDKVLTDWNGLMIAAFARAALAFKEPGYLATARKAADAIWLKVHHDGRLYHRSIGGAVAIDGFLDDYSHYIWGLLEVYRASSDSKYLDRAARLTDTVLTHFADVKGGFFQTDDASEEMIVRLKEDYDGAIPSGNSVMAMNLLVLGTLTGKKEYNASARRIFEAFAIDLAKNPEAYTYMLSAVARADANGRLLALVGKDEETNRGFLEAAESLHDPDLDVIHYDGGQDLPEELKGLITSQIEESETMAFICSLSACEAVRDLPELKRVLLAPLR